MLCSFSLQLIFCSEQPFHGNYLTLDSHTNTVIMASKTVTRSIVFSYSEMIPVSFSFILSFCYVMSLYLSYYYKFLQKLFSYSYSYSSYYYYYLLNYYLIIFHKKYFNFFMFRDVPGCSEMFRVPGFIDALSYLVVALLGSVHA